MTDGTSAKSSASVAATTNKDRFTQTSSVFDLPISRQLPLGHGHTGSARIFTCADPVLTRTGRLGLASQRTRESRLCLTVEGGDRVGVAKLPSKPPLHHGPK